MKCEKGDFCLFVCLFHCRFGGCWTLMTLGQNRPELNFKTENTSNTDYTALKLNLRKES